MSVKSPCHDPQDISTSYDNTASDHYPLFTFFLPFQSTQQSSPPKQLKFFFSTWVPETVANCIFSGPCIHYPTLAPSLFISIHLPCILLGLLSACAESTLTAACSLGLQIYNIQNAQHCILAWKVCLISFILAESILLVVLILFASVFPWDLSMT